MISFQLDKDSSIPLHLQLLTELRHAIVAGQLAPGMRLPSEPVLMQSLAISRTTIRQAWQTAEAEGLLYRVHGKGTYVSNSSSVRPAQIIGFLIPNFRSAFDSQLLLGADTFLREHSYRVMFGHTNREVAVENQMLQEMLSEGVNGFLLWPAWTEGASGFLRSSPSVPTVFMDRPIPGVDCPCVATNHYQGARAAVQHLIGLGHTNIAFVARPHLQLWSISERLRAYEDEMQACGLVPHRPILVGVPEELDTRHAEQYYAEVRGQEIDQLKVILSQADRPTAIFAMNDLMALQVLRAANLAKLNVPADLSLVGFDDMEVASHVIPPLTTVAQDPFRIGSEAARCLLGLLNGDAPGQPIVFLAPHLVVRDSTAPLTHSES